MPSRGHNAGTMPAVVAAAAREFLAAERRHMKDHPEVDDLVAFQEGRLPDARAERVREHLTVCPDCARNVLELGTFDEPAAEPVPDEENERSWELYQKRLSREGGPAGRVVDFRPQDARAVSRGAPAASKWMLAASVLLAVSGGVAWWTTLEERGGAPQELDAPFLFVLRPDGTSQVRDSSPARVVEVPATADVLVPTLLIGDMTSYRGYRAELRTADGDRAFVKDELFRRRDGSFALLIPRSRVPSGSYTLRLFGEDGTTDHLLAAYSFSVREAS